MRRQLATLGSSCLLACVLHGADAHADPSSDRQSAAEQLFIEGRKLLDRGHVDEACTKLARSQELDPSAGTLLNLADCYERSGKLASAWTAFREAMSAASDRRRSDWERLAAKRADALEPRIARLVVNVEGPPPEGLEIRCDGAIVGAGALGTPIPKDFGRHVVEATAPHKRPWRTETSLVAPGLVRVVVPPLEAAPEPMPRIAAPLPTRLETPVEPSRGATQRTVGLVAGGVGLAALGAGAVFGLVANTTLDDAKAVCPSYPQRGPGCAEAEAQASVDDARRMATLSTVGVIAGAALLATGAVLYFTSPRARAHGEAKTPAFLIRF